MSDKSITSLKEATWTLVAGTTFKLSRANKNNFLLFTCSKYETRALNLTN